MDSRANVLTLLKALPSVAKGPTCAFLYCSDPKAKKGKEGRDPVDMVRFSKVKKKTEIRGRPAIFFCLTVSSLLHKMSYLVCPSLRSKSL